MPDISIEQKTLGDIEVEHKLKDIQKRQHFLERLMQAALRRKIRDKIREEHVISIEKVFVQMGAIIFAAFLVYIIFWRFSGGFPLEGFFKH